MEWVQRSGEVWEIVRRSFRKFEWGLDELMDEHRHWRKKHRKERRGRRRSWICWGWEIEWKSESVSCSVMSNSATLWATALCPWNSPGKNTGVGNHSLLQPRNQTWVSHTIGIFFTVWATREALFPAIPVNKGCHSHRWSQPSLVVSWWALRKLRRE